MLTELENKALTHDKIPTRKYPKVRIKIISPLPKPYRKKYQVPVTLNDALRMVDSPVGAVIEVPTGVALMINKKFPGCIEVVQK